MPLMPVMQTNVATAVTLLLYYTAALGIIRWVDSPLSDCPSVVYCAVRVAMGVLWYLCSEREREEMDAVLMHN